MFGRVESGSGGQWLAHTGCGYWLVSGITPCGGEEGIVVHTSHKLERLGDEVILAFRHLVGNLSVTRARALSVELPWRGVNGG